MDKKRVMEIAFRVKADNIPLRIEISAWDAWLLLSLLQMSIRRQDVKHNSLAQQHILVVGQQLQDAIVERHPQAEAILEMGWDEQYDAKDGQQL